MFKAASNTNNSSGDNVNDAGCNLQFIYEKDGRFTSADYILLYVIDMHIRPDSTKGYKK